MTTFKRVSDWSDKDKVNIDDFFLGFDEYPDLYGDAFARASKYEKAVEEGNVPAKVFKKPVEQLSANGTSLMSYLFSVKDNEEAQPLVASTYFAFRRILEFVDNAPVGTSATAIFQATEHGEGHKSVFKMERHSDGLHLINVDSTGSSAPIGPIMIKSMETLASNASTQNRTPTKLFFYNERLNTKEDGESYSRHANEYECGTFSIKDAQQLIRDRTFTENVNKEVDSDSEKIQTLFYTLPASYFKNIQSRQFGGLLSAKHGNTVVNREGKTLREVYDKHSLTDYANHFSEKYKKIITEYVNTHPFNEVKAAVEKYNAATITNEQFLQRYGPPNMPSNRPKG